MQKHITKLCPILTLVLSCWFWGLGLHPNWLSRSHIWLSGSSWPASWCWFLSPFFFLLRFLFIFPLLSLFRLLLLLLLLIFFSCIFNIHLFNWLWGHIRRTVGGRYLGWSFLPGLLWWCLLWFTFLFFLLLRLHLLNFWLLRVEKEIDYTLTFRDVNTDIKMTYCYVSFIK